MDRASQYEEDFSAPDYLFVSTRVARAFPKYLESKIVSAYRSPTVAHEQSKKWNHGGSSIFTHDGRLTRGWSSALSFWLVSLVMIFGSQSPLFQRVAVTTLNPVLLAGIAAIGVKIINSSLFGVIAGTVIFLVAGAIVWWIAQKRREAVAAKRSEQNVTPVLDDCEAVDQAADAVDVGEVTPVVEPHPSEALDTKCATSSVRVIDAGSPVNVAMNSGKGRDWSSSSECENDDDDSGGEYSDTESDCADLAAPPASSRADTTPFITNSSVGGKLHTICEGSDHTSDGDAKRPSPSVTPRGLLKQQNHETKQSASRGRLDSDSSLPSVEEGVHEHEPAEELKSGEMQPDAATVGKRQRLLDLLDPKRKNSEELMGMEIHQLMRMLAEEHNVVHELASDADSEPDKTLPGVKVSDDEHDDGFDLFLSNAGAQIRQLEALLLEDL